MRFGITELIIVLVIVLLLFGTKKLRNIGGDLGGALKGFKKAVNEEPDTTDTADTPELPEKKEGATVKDAEFRQEDKHKL